MSKMAKNAFQQGLQAGAAYLMSNPKGALKKGKDAWNYMTAGGVPSGYTVAFCTVGTFMLFGAVRSTVSPVTGLSSANIGRYCFHLHDERYGVGSASIHYVQCSWSDYFVNFTCRESNPY